jgi:hypothetical protein
MPQPPYLGYIGKVYGEGAQPRRCRAEMRDGTLYDYGRRRSIKNMTAGLI